MQVAQFDCSEMTETLFMLPIKYELATSHQKNWSLVKPELCSTPNISEKSWMHQNTKYNILARNGTVDITTRVALNIPL